MKQAGQWSGRVRLDVVAAPCFSKVYLSLPFHSVGDVRLQLNVCPARRQNNSIA